MTNAAVLTSTNVTPTRGFAQSQRNPSEQGTGAEAAFAALLGQVEQIASTGDQVLTTEAASPLQVLRTNTLQNPGFQTAPEGSLLARLEAAPATATGKPTPTLQLNQVQPRLDGAARREVVDVRPLVQPAAQSPAAASALLPEAIQGVQNIAEDPQLQEQLKGNSAPKLETQVASSPRVDATLAQQSSTETSNPVVRQVASNLQHIVRGDFERVRFDLFPEELGRVQVQLQKSGSNTRLLIVTENPQAFEALQRGAQGLQASLQQSGFDADDLQFQHQGERGEHREATDERRERRDDHRSETDPQERREVIVRPALTSADQALFL